tara:strand:+ start:16 stop:198 length:183 start_codon:yes stop_codon:yes gene_type:complete
MEEIVMEIVFWVMLGLILIGLYLIHITIDKRDKWVHNDSRPSSFYQQSQKKQWQKREMDK